MHLVERLVVWLVMMVMISPSYGQGDIVKGYLDLTQEVKALSLKSQDSYTSNTLALPLLQKQKTKKNLSWEQSDPNVFHTEIILGPHRESYLMLADVVLVGNETLIVQDQEGRAYEYNHEDNVTSQRLMTDKLTGDIKIAYYGPQPKMRLKQVYTNPNVGAMDLGFGAAFECQINVNCDEGRPYADEKNGVMRIRMVAEEGVALCTGTLLNNTAEDGDPLVLTAYHCLYPANSELTPLFDMWMFDFNYESRSCANPEAEPGVVALQGAEVLADWQETDMMLLRIAEDIPASANAYYVGWDRRPDYNPIKTALIHQPAGDIKKITIDNEAVTPFDDVISWNNSTTTPAGSHFINEFDEGVYQPGSSGCGLFDDEGRVIGQLHGGPLSDEFCTIGIGYSGRLSVSWDSGDGPDDRLQDWLDPLGTGVMRMDGTPANATNQIVQFKGRVVTSKGIAIPDVRIGLTGDLEASFLTGADGRFIFDNLSTKKKYSITLTKETNASNGLSVVDIISMQNHILGRKAIDDDFGLRAADVNQDGKISSIDLVQMRNVMIGRDVKFGNSDSWRFLPGILELNGENVGAGVLEISVIGYKVGDVNGSANPRN